MRLNSLHLVNFRQHADTRLTFDSGLTGVIGANGSGKSTLLEAIAYALYGAAAARETKETIRFFRAGPRAQVKVDLDFDLAGHRYRVIRGLTNAELYLDGQTVPIANAINTVNDVLRRRLGMSREEFFNTYFTGQKDLSVMSAMTAADRAKFLNQVLGYERLRAAQDLARERKRDLFNTMVGLRAGMPDPDTVAVALAEAERKLGAARARLREIERRRAAAQIAFDEAAPRWQAAQQERERWQEMQSELRVVEAETGALARDRERVERELAEIAIARAEQERLARELAPLAETVSALHEMEALYREEGRRRALQDGERTARDEVTRLRERYARIETAPALEEQTALELQGRRDELEQLHARLEARRTEWVRDRQEAETKRQALRQQYAELRDQRERLVAAGEEGICPTCNRPLGGHYRSVLDLLDAQLETVRVDGNYYKSRLEQLEEVPADITALDEQRRQAFEDVGALERRHAKLQLTVSELTQLTRDVTARELRHEAVARELAAIPSGYDAARHDRLRREVERLTPLDARSARLGAQIDREPQLRREQDRVTRDGESKGARLAELRSALAGADFAEEAYVAVRGAYEAAQAELRAAELTAVAVQGDMEAARDAVVGAERAQRELARVQEQLAVLQRERRLNEELDRAFNDIRTDLNQALRPEISALGSEFLTELTDARYNEMELDEAFHIRVLEDGLPKPVISGGEEDLANLVFRLAISQLIAERAGQSFSLLILDEVFGSLDELRRHNVIELLRRLRDRFEQVIVITHVESVREGLDRVIAVHFDEESGASIVEQSDVSGALLFEGGELEGATHGEAAD